MSAELLTRGWNARRGEAVSESFTADGRRIEVARPGARLEGREAIAAHTQAYIGAVPDCVLDVRFARSMNGITLFEWTFRGTHTGDAPGFPATGRTIHLDGVSVLEMDGDLIAEERVYWDAATLFGLLEEVAP